MRQIRRATTISILAAAFLVPSAKAQTVGELIAGYQAVNNLLQSSLATAGAEGRSVANTATGALDSAVRSLQQMVNGDLTRQITTLSGTALALAQTIQGSVNSLNALLNQRLTCALQGTEYLIYGVNTITKQLQTALPLVRNGTPYLYGFAFDGHFWGVVPSQGGRAVVKGYGLWQHNRAPKVRLVDENGSALADLRADRAQGDDMLAVQIASLQVQKLAGKCGLIEVTPNGRQLMTLPMCVPRTENAQVYFEATGTFEDDATLPDKQLNEFVLSCTNDSCEHRGDCHAAHTWTIDSGCTVKSDVHAHRGSNFWGDGHNVSLVAHADGTINADGTTDTASCVSGPFGIGARRYHSSVWEMVVAPVVSCKVTFWVPARQQSAEWQLDVDTGPHCVTLQRASNGPSSWSSKIWIKYGAQDPVQFAEVPATAPVTVPQPATLTVGGVVVNAQYTPDIGGNKGQACVTLQVPKCGY